MVHVLNRNMTRETSEIKLSIFTFYVTKRSPSPSNAARKRLSTITYWYLMPLEDQNHQNLHRMCLKLYSVKQLKHIDLAC